MDDTIIIGQGEIGKALFKVLLCEHIVRAKDVHDPEGPECDVMHICFPWSERFEAEVRRYQEAYKPEVTIVHSTVKVGTCSRLGAVHSPVVGVHPDLVQSLRTFTKFVGGDATGRASKHLMEAGLRVKMFDKPETTELLKLLSTATYAVSIEWTKEVKRRCDKAGVPFEAWDLWTENYNDGYAAMGRPERTRPRLTPVPGRIGGHCVMPNLEMIPADDFVMLVQRRNAPEEPEWLD